MHFEFEDFIASINRSNTCRTGSSVEESTGPTEQIQRSRFPEVLFDHRKHVENFSSFEWRPWTIDKMLGADDSDRDHKQML